MTKETYMAPEDKKVLVTYQDGTTRETTFQNSYDHLIQLSDAAFKNSENPALIEAELQTEWAAKSEAYQYAAQLFADTCYVNGIPVETKIPLREQTIEQDRHESIEADVRNELTLTETE